MNNISSQNTIDNFDLSIIMPFYKRMYDFRLILPRNSAFFQRNGIEVIIVMDDQEEKEELITFIQTYPFINWKVIVNETPHESRNPAKVINVGIRNASKKYIMVCSPESEFYSDVILLLRKKVEYYPFYFATGYVSFVDYNYMPIEKQPPKNLMNYGSFMVEKAFIEEINGYDETYTKWGGEDDNIRKRLELKGIRNIKVPEAIVLHREKKNSFSQRGNRTKEMPDSNYIKSTLPMNYLANDDSIWGKDFDKIIFNWKESLYKKAMCINYLQENFINFSIQHDRVFDTHYHRLILCQSYNEKENIDSFLTNMSQFFDGIILLDDESTDHSYEVARHNKLLLKVKKSRTEFNDLQNRNILLNIASFFKSDWFCFMDLDERFDLRFANFDFTAKNEHDVIFFRLVHLWDDEKHYNAEYPFSNHGIQYAMRMFRNIGRVQIQSENGKLHFPCVPYKSRLLRSNILFLHHGHISKEKRIKKYKFYLQEDKDKNQSSYEHFLANPKKLLVEQIK